MSFAMIILRYDAFNDGRGKRHSLYPDKV